MIADLIFTPVLLLLASVPAGAALVRLVWRDGPAPNVPRHALEAFVVGGSLYAVGGCTTALRDSPVVERIRVGSRA